MGYPPDVHVAHWAGNSTSLGKVWAITITNVLLNLGVFAGKAGWCVLFFVARTLTSGRFLIAA